MNCSCCGKKKGFFESFEKVEANGVQLALCTDCATLLYGVRTAAQENEQEAMSEMQMKLQKRIEKGKASATFLEWYKGYLKQF